MPVTAQCTCFFGSDAGRGWSETHNVSLATPVGDLLPVLQSFKTLMENFRRPLLGMDRYIKGLRVSYKTTSGAIASSPYRYTPYLYPGNQKPGCSPAVAAQLRMGSATNQQFSNVFLRGFWDAVETNEQLNFLTADGVAWKALMEQFVAALVAGQYGWPATDDAATPRGRVTGYTLDPDNFVTFAVAREEGGAMPIAGKIFTMRSARINNSNSVLNRSLVVQAISATSVKTVRPIAAGPFIDQGTFVIPVRNFVRYTGLQYAVLAKKAEGRPTFLSPARQPAQARV